MNDTNILNHLFDKQALCPVCDSKFTTKTVKSKSPRIISKDSDFFVRYSVANPYFYDVCICNSCGYAAMRADFEKLKTNKKTLVLSNVTPKWKPREYPDISDERLAIERYKLALLNAMLVNLPDSTKAMISLKIAWMNRLLNDTAQEALFLRQALEGFNNAYIKEIFPIYGLQKDSLMYLLGELSRRTGDYQTALLWYSKTIVNTNSSYKIKEMARIGKDSIKNIDI